VRVLFIRATLFLGPQPTIDRLEKEKKRKTTMAHDVIPLGTVPSHESSAQISQTGYAAIAFLQCRRFIVLLRDVIGLEPEGAWLRVRRSEQAFDPYIEVVVEYDDQNSVARAYAMRCEREAPEKWK
jgi:hypothetical protein